MAVDHGLGGRESRKSREKRAKRLEKKIRKVKLGENKKIKREVIFDEKSRVEFLTGFRKRKQERRQYGLAMQYLKDKEASKALKLKAPPLIVEEKDEDSLNGDDDEKKKNDQNITSFNDQHTESMFGGVVSVEIGTNVLEQMNEAFEPRKRTFQQPTKLERAMKKAKQIMHFKDTFKKGNKSSRGGGGGGISGRVDNALRQSGGAVKKKRK